MPLPLHLVAVSTVLFGVWCALDVAEEYVQEGRMMWHPGVLQIPAGFGLLRLRNGWRTIVLVGHWLGLLIVALSVVACFADPLALVATLAMVPYLIWEYRVLTNPDVKRLFGV